MDIRYFGTTPRYSEAVCAGGLIFLSGMVENGETAAEQTADVLAQTDRWLAECGSDKAHVLDAVIYLRDMGDYAEMNGVWDAWVAMRQNARPRLRGSAARPSGVARRNQNNRREERRGNCINRFPYIFRVRK